MESFATPYPIFFFDGEHDQEKGHVGVHSALTFKRFQAQMSQKTGIPANQLSAVFVCKKTYRDVEKRQKLPINENTNFSIILNQHNPSKEKDCHFLVSIKKSKKERKVSRKRSADVENNADDDDEDDDVENNAFLSPTSPMDWSSPSESGSIEGSGNVSPANRIVSDGKVELTLLRRPDTLQSGYTAEKKDVDDCAVEPQVENCSGVVESKNESANTPAAVQSHSANLNVQQEYQRKHDVQAIQEIPFGAYEVSPERGISQRLMSSQFNVQMPHSELFNHERYGENISQVPNLRPSMSMIRNGVVSAGYAAQFNRASNMSPSFSLSMSPPLSNHFGGRASTSSMSSAGFFPSRVPFPSPAAPVSFTSRDINLQRMQSHILQAHHHEPQVRMTPHDLPRYNAGFCNWVPVVTTQGDHQQSLCEVCYDFKRRNIYPTPFHWCVQDRVTLGFRGPSPAGPIERPGKRRLRVAG
ncbi:uncharacterized protein LOC131056347 [Cryptomeria japonica]|uniref:uncharacterized protein LOC131056347 n=1 Tax=Cryptomeria japonica TaxID=3369 RepID=UPI0027DA4A15|nr:uncharacterized protein LOC131056347 [Cryptomeria japonica]XP_059063992.1 uncharacterized protein LOC131056347 [Cryptomeria japonica]